MDKQEIFNKVATHLLTQGEKSLDGEACMYRGEGGRKCAIGAIIPDEIYDPVIENATPTMLFTAALRTGGPFFGPSLVHIRKPEFIAVAEKITAMLGVTTETLEGDPAFLTELQNIHDSADPVFWVERLRSVANHYRLDASVLRAA